MSAALEIRMPPGPYRAHEAAAVRAIETAVDGGAETIAGERAWRTVLILARQIPGTTIGFGAVGFPGGGTIERSR